MTRTTARAPAKVNLLLRVFDRDDTGFHRLRTVFARLELADELEVEAGRGTRAIALQVLGADTGPAHRNLAYRAADAFLDRAGLERSIGIRLLKRIPVGAGLGGGSSDAAATLLALDRLLPDAVPGDALRSIAAGLGSDVPFFMARAPLAIGEGRGDRITPLPGLPPRPVLLVIPPFPVATAEAYQWLDSARADGSAPRDSPAGPPVRSWDDISREAANDFEEVVFPRHPLLRQARDALLAEGAEPALLAGSGSTVFGVFEDAARLAAARVRLEALDRRLSLVETQTAR